jgi:hypothetical protein
VLSFMTESIVRLLDELERTVPLCLDNRPDPEGGCRTVTDELPASGFDGTHVRWRDKWRGSNAQGFSEVSPDMHWEFALQYQVRILDRFGLNAYGCCEPLDRKLEFVKRIPRLRRVSISPWADVRRSAEGLQGDYVFSWKPNPACVADTAFEADTVRAGILLAGSIGSGVLNSFSDAQWSYYRALLVSGDDEEQSRLQERRWHRCKRYSELGTQIAFVGGVLFAAILLIRMVLDLPSP